MQKGTRQWLRTGWKPASVNLLFWREISALCKVIFLLQTIRYWKQIAEKHLMQLLKISSLNPNSPFCFIMAIEENLLIYTAKLQIGYFWALWRLSCWYHFDPRNATVREQLLLHTLLRNWLGIYWILSNGVSFEYQILIKRINWCFFVNNSKEEDKPLFQHVTISLELQLDCR